MIHVQRDQAAVGRTFKRLDETDISVPSHHLPYTVECAKQVHFQTTAFRTPNEWKATEAQTPPPPRPPPAKTR